MTFILFNNTEFIGNSIFLKSAYLIAILIFQYFNFKISIFLLIRSLQNLYKNYEKRYNNYKSIFIRSWNRHIFNYFSTKISCANNFNIIPIIDLVFPLINFSKFPKSINKNITHCIYSTKMITNIILQNHIFLNLFHTVTLEYNTNCEQQK